MLELLSILLIKATKRGLIKGLRVGGRGSNMDIIHLLFADDMIIFCQSDVQQLIHLRCILMWFNILSGLHVNLNKS